MLLSLTPEARAQPFVDLDIQAAIDSPEPFVPGNVALLTFTIANHAPDTAAAVSVISVEYPFLDFELFSLVPGESDPCEMFYDDFQAPPGRASPASLSLK